jgi:hypothetical protein
MSPEGMNYSFRNITLFWIDLAINEHVISIIFVFLNKLTFIKLTDASTMNTCQAACV